MQSHSDFPALTTEQVAERLHISPATIYRLLARREGPPSYKIGRRRLWREAEILDWLERQCRQRGSHHE